MKKILLLVLFLWSSCAWGESAPPQVVVSVKPVHALVAGVMQGVAEPQLLVKTGSPHGYVLRPSEARALARADLIVWVGEDLEGFLVKPLTTLGRHSRQLELMAALRSELLPLRSGGSWERHSHAASEPHDLHHHEDVALNPHLWLSPKLAGRIVSLVAADLSRIDPARKELYRQNAEHLRQRLDALDRDLATKLAPVKAVPFVVFHDAYQYFEAAYGLNAVGSITIDPERRPGVKRLLEMRQKIKRLNARCVFSEPQFEPKLVATIIEGTGAKSGQLDPVGADLEPGAESYFHLLNRLAADLLTGLR